MPHFIHSSFEFEIALDTLFRCLPVLQASLFCERARWLAHGCDIQIFLAALNTLTKFTSHSRAHTFAILSVFYRAGHVVTYTFLPNVRVVLFSAQIPGQEFELQFCWWTLALQTYFVQWYEYGFRKADVAVWSLLKVCFHLWIGFMYRSGELVFNLHPFHIAAAHVI